jgi:hypothetical protein
VAVDHELTRLFHHGHGLRDQLDMAAIGCTGLFEERKDEPAAKKGLLHSNIL